MKKMIWSFGIVFCIVVLAIGCVKKENSRTEHTTEQKYSKSFGEFYVSSKWGESQEHSTDDVFFYVKEGTEKQRQPDNIAVSIGKNPYSKEESESFKEAIKKQISEQLSGYSNVTMTASGFQSGDNTVYLFTVEENDTGLITNQFYIVGEKKYCLVQESNFDKSEECDEVTKSLVESFKWK
ncbi:MAG: hypothetical protein ACLT97_15310 [Faecalibacillus intestinalis]|uniref:hypothetical protein n=1 Tax=Faecalibacillus intestinalis TaxID=1982626 RepID=UPI000E4CFDAE|nr:hypothetical protein DXC84_14605 [Ruminococcus sp. TF08-4]